MAHARIVKFLINLRFSFWFYPALLVAAGGVLALVALEIDTRVSNDALEAYPRLFGAGYDGSREMLSSIAVSMITVAGVVFSITIVALSLAAGQYSPRVLRTFMSDRPNQLVLGVFLGIYTYCLLVLRSVRGGDEAFVAAIAVVIGVVLALIGVGFLIFFIHHIAVSLQVSHIAERIASEARDTMDQLFRRPLAQALEQPRFAPEEHAWHEVLASEVGYVQRIEVNDLMDVARETGETVMICCEPGDFAAIGSPLARISGAAPPSDRHAEAIRSACILNTYRDIAQDPAFGFQQLVDIALKALSSGINDTSTARMSADRMMGLLAHIADRCLEEDRFHVEEGRVRVVMHGPHYEALVDSAFDPLRRNSQDNVDMALHLLLCLGKLARFTRVPARRDVLRRHVEAVVQLLAHARVTDKDKAAAERRVQEVRAQFAD